MASATSGLVSPFCPAVVNATFAAFEHADLLRHREHLSVRYFTRNKHGRLAERRARPPPASAGHASWDGLFAALKREGISASASALELSSGYRLPRANSHLDAALDQLAFTDDSRATSNLSRVRTPRSNAAWARLLWQADAPLIANLSSAPPAPPAPESPLLAPLLRDGFVAVHDFGLNTSALREQAYAMLRRSGRLTTSGELITARGPLPAIEPLLRNETFAAAVRGYLGGSARYDGHAVFQLMPGANVESYPSGLWHHDRCGRRLRVFLYVHAVGEGGRPTLFARGSHRALSYYSYIESLQLTRFSERYVRSRFEVVSLTGAAGGGFVLDTNGLHRARLEGDPAHFNRTAVLLEFHAHRKIPALAKHPAVLSYPCPSIKSGPHSFTAGVPGWPLYPPDDAPPYQRRKGRVVFTRNAWRRGGGAKRGGGGAKQGGGGGAKQGGGGAKQGGGGAKRGGGGGGTQGGGGAKRGGGGGGTQGGGGAKQGGGGARGGGGGGAGGAGEARRARQLETAALAREPMAAPPAAAATPAADVRRAEGAALAADLRDARACFARRPLASGCAAVYVVAPAPARTGYRRAFAAMAAASARSLKRALPSARAVLVLGTTRCAAGGAAGARAANATTAAEAAQQAAEAEEEAALPLGAFDAVERWCEPALYALAGRYAAGRHRGWLLKPAMLAAASPRRALFLDSDTAVEAQAVASLFALLHRDDGPDFFAAAEVATSLSRRALGGGPLFNTGVLGLRRSSAGVARLLRQWQATSWRIACALPSAERTGLATPPPVRVPAQLGSAAAWQLATNDQYGLARLLTPASPREAALANLSSWRLLGSEFNWRGAMPDGGSREPPGGAVVVRHDGASKQRELREVARELRKAQARTASGARARGLAAVRSHAASEAQRAAEWAANAEQCKRAPLRHP